MKLDRQQLALNYTLILVFPSPKTHMLTILRTYGDMVTRGFESISKVCGVTSAEQECVLAPAKTLIYSSYTFMCGNGLVSITAWFIHI